MSKHGAMTITGAEVDTLIESLELSLGDYEENYWELDGHDSPEEWIIARQQYLDWVGLYVKFTGQKWRGSHHLWDENGPHEMPVMLAGDHDEVTEGGS